VGVLWASVVAQVTTTITHINDNDNAHINDNNNAHINDKNNARIKENNKAHQVAQGSGRGIALGLRRRPGYNNDDNYAHKQGHFIKNKNRMKHYVVSGLILDHCYIYEYSPWAV
jgi:hypothetical protein